MRLPVLSIRLLALLLLILTTEALLAPARQSSAFRFGFTPSHGTCTRTNLPTSTHYNKITRMQMNSVLKYPFSPAARASVLSSAAHRASVLRLYSSTTDTTASTTTSPSPSLLATSLSTSDTPPKLIFVTGKGGVGKTSTSASLALLIADRTENKNVLLVSTDPAHSVHDCLAIPKPSMPKVEAFDTLGSQSTSKLYVSEVKSKLLVRREAPRC